MVSFLKHFFRGTPDDYKFPAYGLEHILLVLLCFYVIFLLIKYREKLRNTILGRNVKISLIAGLLLQQIILYLWYGFSGYFTIKESLPLYNCRIAIIFTALALLTNKKIFRNVSVYWGIIGTIMAFASPDLDPFMFPHYTRVSFFLGHFLLIWGGIYILVIDEYRINKVNFREMLHFTNTYHIFILIFNIITDSNYCYIMEPPVLKNIYEMMPQALYTSLAFLFFNALVSIVYFTTIGIYEILVQQKASSDFGA